MHVKPVAATFLLAVILYYAHRLLQLQHYRYCKSDLIRVVLFDQSAMCVHITNVLHIVEVASQQVVRQVTSHVLNSINGGTVNWLGTLF